MDFNLDITFFDLNGQELSIDLDLLKQQKLTLLNLMDKTDNQKVLDDLSGILNILDIIHDAIEPM